MTYIHALEENPPPGREPNDWKLVTNLPVEDLSAAIEKLGWYALRWKAEVFHKVMKSGCRAEEARLKTAERLAKFLAPIAVSHILRHYVGAREARRRARHRLHLGRDHCARPGRRVPNATAPPTAHARRLPLQIAMLCGYLARNCDPPPRQHGRLAQLDPLHDTAFGISTGSSQGCGRWPEPKTRPRAALVHP